MITQTKKEIIAELKILALQAESAEEQYKNTFNLAEKQIFKVKLAESWARIDALLDIYNTLPRNKGQKNFDPGT